MEEEERGKERKREGNKIKWFLSGLMRHPP